MENWNIDVPSQGIHISGDKEKIREFLNSEIAYYTRLALSGVNIVLASQGYGNIQVTEPATRELSRIAADVEAEKTQSLQQYISDARSRQILVGASAAGKRVEQVKKESAAAAALLAAILCPKWAQMSHPTGRELVSIFRAVAFANPANFAFDDLLDASESAADAKQAKETSEAAADKLDAFIDEKTKLIAELENLYRQKLTIQEPAVSWQSIAVQKARIWRFWLGLFAVMIAAPVAAALLEWNVVASAVSKITASANGRFSISALAVITVPALLYAWLLKNISRVFIQNLNLADDADHRRSLALTYMGLLQDEKRPATEQDRAIILNALFRPMPPHTGDEGPPSGLIDLIKK